MSSEKLFALVALATAGTFTPRSNTALCLPRLPPVMACAVLASWGLLLILNTAGLGVMMLSYPPLH